MTEKDYIEIVKAISKNDWDEKPVIQVGKYSVYQFQGTAFDSNYKCYKIQWSELKYVVPAMRKREIGYSCVVKQTNSVENEILRMLSEKQFSVPKLGPTLCSDNGKLMIFMDFLPGVELYESQNQTAWVNTAIELSKVHREFWQIETAINYTAGIPTSKNILFNKLEQACKSVSHKHIWKVYMNWTLNRFRNAPRTLIHGDMFPTNVLIYREKPTFIDWADSGIAPYMLDIGRLTSCIDMDKLLPICPCSQKVIDAYFENMASVLQLDYKNYLKDIHMAQFVELASCYYPPGFLEYETEFNQKIEQRLNEIVEFYFK